MRRGADNDMDTTTSQHYRTFAVAALPERHHHRRDQVVPWLVAGQLRLQLHAHAAAGVAVRLRVVCMAVGNVWA